MEENSIISLSNLSVYQKNKLVLTDVNLKVYSGEFVYLIGKTGSGKSSLLQIIYADLPVEDGEAVVCNYNLKTISPSQKSAPALIKTKLLQSLAKWPKRLIN